MAVVLALWHVNNGASQYPLTIYGDPTMVVLALKVLTTVYLGIHLPSTENPMTVLLALWHVNSNGVSYDPLTSYLVPMMVELAPSYANGNVSRFLLTTYRRPNNGEVSSLICQRGYIPVPNYPL